MSRGEIRFGVDAAGFATGGATTREEVYLQIPNPEMGFRRVGDDSLFASIEAKIAWSDTGTGDVLFEKTLTAQLTASSEEETRDHGQVHVLQSEFLLAPGRYRLEVRVWDEHRHKSIIPLLITKRLSGSASLELEVPSYADSSMRLSDLEFAREITPDSSESAFRKGTLSVVPCPERTYGLLIPELSVYFEIYDRGAEEHEPVVVDLSSEVVNSKGATVQSREESLRMGGGSRWARSTTFDLSEIPPGKYQITVRLTNTHSGETASARGDFDVVWAMLSWRKDQDELVKELAPVASPADIDRLKNSSSGEREIFLEAFWKALDPTPETPRNEALEEHYRRIRSADRAFRARKRGSQTDRGKVFVKFGEPDEITVGFSGEEFIGDAPILRKDNFDFSDEGRARGGFNYEEKSYETWSYDQRGRPIGVNVHSGSGPGLRFVFADLSGYGDYKMVYSSEPIEY